MRMIIRGLAAWAAIAALLSCASRETRLPTATGLPTATSTTSEEITIGPAAVGVHRERFGVGALIRNTGTSGVRDIELSVRFFSADELVLSVSDVLAFCPREATCPWGTSFGITDDEQRSIDSAEVAIAGVGEPFEDGTVRPIDLNTRDGSVSFDLPQRPGVAIVYATRGDGPYYGLSIAHEGTEPASMSHNEEFIPIGPETHAVFYDGYIPSGRRAGGD